MEALSVYSSVRSVFTSAPWLAAHRSAELTRRLTELGAANGVSGAACDGPLLSTAETIGRLDAARELASTLVQPLFIVAGTAAQTAIGLDAAIARARQFAPYADAVCLMSPAADLAEAAEFASVVHGAFPEKKLGFGYLPAGGARWNELDRLNFEAGLRQLGYDFYFLSRLGQAVFLKAPAAGAWVLIDDARRIEVSKVSKVSEVESGPAVSPHRRRVASGHAHSPVRRLAGQFVRRRRVAGSGERRKAS